MEIQSVPDTVNSAPPGADVRRSETVVKPSLRGADILVVIPAYNEASHIETCIRSLLEGGDPRTAEADVVVVDGASTDGTKAVVERLQKTFSRLALMDNPERLQSAAINRAARLMGAGKSVLVRCDAHASYPPNYVMRVAESLVAHGVASIATPMDAEGTSCFQKANAFIVDTPLGSGGSAHRGGRTSMEVDHGHHAGFDMATFLKLGGYDPGFSHNEDGEYDRRLKAAGGRIFLDADIRVRYTPRATVKALARQYFNYGKGRARNLTKHGDVPKLRQMVPQMVLLLSVLGLALAPFEPLLLVLPLGYIGLLALVSVVATIHMRSACGLLAGLASGAMHMSWAAGFFRQWLWSRHKDEPRTLPPLEPAKPTHAE